MPGVSFDRAATFYDATRGYPPGVDVRLRDAIVRAAGLRPDAELLEIGVGTGRIALPFALAGYRYTGVDISLPMMAALREKLGGDMRRVQLVAGDVTRLPLADACADAVVAVHILHLVDDWRAALLGSWRALRPGGAIVLANDDRADDSAPSPTDSVFPAWSGFLDELGVPPEQRRSGAVRGLDERFAELLRELGARVERLELLRYDREPRTLRQEVRHYIERVFSSVWALPDDTHRAASARLEEWLAQQPDPDTPHVSRGAVAAIVARREEAA